MPHQTCEHCHKNVATVTVIELPPRQAAEGGDTGGPTPSEQHLCEICAQAKDLPHAPVVKNIFGDIWKLLRAPGSEQPRREERTCPDCGMTLEELRTRGRIGCVHDYEVFAEEIQQILERVHGSTRHVGRIPGLSPGDLHRMQTITSLKDELAVAIREEQYESAARIRDELQDLGETV